VHEPDGTREPDGTQHHDEPQLLPVALIHGLIGTLDDDDLLNRLAPRPVLAVDLLGYGRHRDQAPDGIDSQVEHLRRVLDGARLGRVHLVGHSAGGVVAVLFAHRHPDRVASLVNVEGNFTLVDAFWSTKVTRMGPAQFAEVLAGYQSEPAGWLRESGIRPDERRVALARRWLGRQPAATVHAMARDVIEATTLPTYLETVRETFAEVPVHLVAGAWSRDGWDVPPWALDAAASLTLIPDAGHLMMLEQPGAFADAVTRVLTEQDAAKRPSSPSGPSS